MLLLYYIQNVMSIVTSLKLQVYVERFGESKDDWGLVAEIDGKIVGAVWVSLSIQKTNYAEGNSYDFQQREKKSDL